MTPRCLSALGSFAGVSPTLGGNAGMFAREIGTDGLPGIAAVGGFEKNIRRVVEDVRIDRRKNDRLRAIGAVLGIGGGNGSDILHLARFQREYFVTSRRPAP